jgi:3-dehydroquinate dehydratase-2
VAIADALKAVQIPFVEVHISAVNEREEFRKISFIRDFALATVTGKGFSGYIEAIDMLISNFGEKK